MTETSFGDLKTSSIHTWVTTRGWKSVAYFLDISTEMELIVDIKSSYFSQFHTRTLFM
jgi:hypothetical protein